MRCKKGKKKLVVESFQISLELVTTIFSYVSFFESFFRLDFYFWIFSDTAVALFSVLFCLSLLFRSSICSDVTWLPENATAQELSEDQR